MHNPKHVCTFQVAWLYVRQGVSDRGSANVTDLIAIEQQQLQRLVMTANQTQTHICIDNDPAGKNSCGVTLNDNKCIKPKMNVLGGDFVHTSAQHRSHQLQHYQYGCIQAKAPATYCFDCQSCIIKSPKKYRLHKKKYHDEKTLIQIGERETYTRASPIETAPASPILFA